LPLSVVFCSDALAPVDQLSGDLGTVARDGGTPHGHGPRLAESAISEDPVRGRPCQDAAAMPGSLVSGYGDLKQIYDATVVVQAATVRPRQPIAVASDRRGGERLVLVDGAPAQGHGAGAVDAGAVLGDVARHREEGAVQGGTDGQRDPASHPGPVPGDSAQAQGDIAVCHRQAAAQGCDVALDHGAVQGDGEPAR
jgi:hypothetical protein